ncbi:MAG: hypothetical protein O6705_03455 [Actinobacteria bacterium]|nr:hypothetical protein [Actinomycetota bacterium]
MRRNWYAGDRSSAGSYRIGIGRWGRFLDHMGGCGWGMAIFGLLFLTAVVVLVA